MESSLKDNLGQFFEQFKVNKYKRGEIILRPGDKPNYVGFIKSGFVRVYTLNENGQEITTQFFKPIFYFTLIYGQMNIENRYYFEAITPVEMYMAPVDKTLEFLKENKELSKKVMNNLMLAFLDLIDQLGYLLSGTAYNKVAAMLVSLTSRTEKDEGQYSQIEFGITHRLIASLTGLTRETVTLQMIRLEKEGFIQNKNKKVKVLNRGGLVTAAKTET